MDCFVALLLAMTPENTRLIDVDASSNIEL
jgi:hypothetical protein